MHNTKLKWSQRAATANTVLSDPEDCQLSTSAILMVMIQHYFFLGGAESKPLDNSGKNFIGRRGSWTWQEKVPVSGGRGWFGREWFHWDLDEYADNGAT